MAQDMSLRGDKSRPGGPKCLQGGSCPPTSRAYVEAYLSKFDALPPSYPQVQTMQFLLVVVQKYYFLPGAGYHSYATECVL